MNLELFFNLLLYLFFSILYYLFYITLYKKSNLALSYIKIKTTNFKYYVEI